MTGKFVIKMSSHVAGVDPLFHPEREVSFRDVLRIRQALSELHGSLPVVKGVGVGRRDGNGNRRHFKYAWESRLTGDRRATNVLWIRVISWK